MDYSLTNYLEASTTRTPSSIPFHVQVNICSDVALALSFLHSNGIIHRDLSGNNVLLAGQPNIRAKVTDFGMASLIDQLSPQTIRTFTMCPGTDVYMPPEAVKEQPTYSEKIDCFSFGVIIVQILTRKLPNPGNRLKEIKISNSQIPNLMAYVSEHERRQEHISEADQGTPLLPIALDCLKDKDAERPSAQQLCEQVLPLKELPRYRETIHSSSHFYTEQPTGNHTEYDRQLEELQKQVDHQTQQIQDLHQICQSQERQFKHEVAQKGEVIEQQERIIAQKDAVIKQKEGTIFAGQEKLQQIGDKLQQLLRKKERLEEQLKTMEQQHSQEIKDLQQKFQCQVDQLVQDIEQKEKIISKQKALLNHKEATKEQTELPNDQIATENIEHDSDYCQTKKEGELVEQQLSSRRHGRILSLTWDGRRSLPCPLERDCDAVVKEDSIIYFLVAGCLLYTSPSPRDATLSRMPSSA